MSRRSVSSVLVVLVIVLSAWPLMRFRMDHYLPEVDNDEVSYFLQVKTFLFHGFSGGYFFVNDQVPAAPIRFDTHGPILPAIYGSVAHIIGWRNYSPYIVNLIFFLTAFALLVFSTREHPSNQVAVVTFVLLHGYFFMFLPSMMEESFHISVAIALAALWNIALDRGRSGVWRMGVCVCAVAVASLVRLTWALVLPVLLFSFVRERYGTPQLLTLKNAILGVLAGV